MSSKKEEERNEKTIRGLMKLPPNRRCINCNSAGPQYVCTNFWTFVCIACSGIHREFTHRVKSVSMAKFTKQEVEALQRGGNQCAREMFLKHWNAQQMRLPDSSNPDKIRAFIKDVYVNKKYAGGRSSDKPPTDMQSHEEEHRRVSSYHSFSQSPPYENQYDDRRYGKQMGKRSGSDRGIYERKITSFGYSTGNLREQMYEDKFANESFSSKTSDYSVSSTSDQFRFDGHSPNFGDTGYSSSPLSQGRNFLVGSSQPQILNRYPDLNVKRDTDRFLQRTASSSSLGSFDSNSVSLKSANSGSIVDAVLESEHSIGTQRAVSSAFPSLSESSASMLAGNQDLFNLPFAQLPMTSSAPSLDFFAAITNQPPSTNLSEQRSSTVPFSENERWATFDLPHHLRPVFETNERVTAMVTPVDVAPKGTEDALKYMHNNSHCFSIQSSAARRPFLSLTDQQNVGLQEDRTPADQKDTQSWTDFGDSDGSLPHTSFGVLPRNIDPQIQIQKSHTSVFDQYVGLKAPEDVFVDGLQKLPMDDTISGPSLPFNAFVGSSFPPSALLLTGGTNQVQKSTNPFDLPYDSDSEANNMLDMSSLQSALSDPQLPTAQHGGVTQQWFHQNSVLTYIPSFPHDFLQCPGGVSNMSRQASNSQLQNLPPHGSVRSLGGNPFA